jgi:hypothetical protein
MATIDATVGGAASNSFVTELEQIAYVADRLNLSSWTTVSGSTLTDDEKKALIEATREINRMRFIGARVNDTQALAWPRQNATNLDSATFDYFSTTVLPQRLKNATMELAVQFIEAGTTDVAALPDTDNVKRDKIDVLEVEYFEYGRKRGLRRYPRVSGELSTLLESSSGLTSPLVRG